jgi:hypothetical protein
VPGEVAVPEAAVAEVEEEEAAAVEVEVEAAVPDSSGT